MLVRMALYWLMAQALVIVVVAAAVPGGSSWLTLAGFVTANYDDNIFALHLVCVPWTDPAAYVSLQTFVQMLSVAMAAAALTTLVRTNPWQHGVLPDSTVPGRDKPARAPGPAGPADVAGSPPATPPPSTVTTPVAPPPPGPTGP